jgi:DNA-binding MarR family transcriptional regulator
MAVRTGRHTQDAGRAALRTWLRLLACTNMIEKHVRSQLRQRFRSTLPRFDVLAELDVAEKHLGRGITMSELSHRLMVTNGNVTGLVEQLVKNRLVSRNAAPHDRRSQLVRLTRSGQRAFDRMVPEHRAWVEKIFASLSRRDHAAIYRLLGKLKDAIQRDLQEEHE